MLGPRRQRNVGLSGDASHRGKRTNSPSRLRQYIYCTPIPNSTSILCRVSTLPAEVESPRCRRNGLVCLVAAAAPALRPDLGSCVLLLSQYRSALSSRAVVLWPACRTRSRVFSRRLHIPNGDCFTAFEQLRAEANFDWLENGTKKAGLPRSRTRLHGNRPSSLPVVQQPPIATRPSSV